MDKQKKTTKKKKTENINIRVTKSDKKKLEKKAKDNNMSLSEYLITAGLRNNMLGKDMLMAHITAIAQQICNYAEENYDEDEKLEKWNEELWENLS